jgi:hypothetical protein
MTPEQIQKTTIEKLDLIMLPIVKEFEENKALSYEVLSTNWEKHIQKLYIDKFEIICNILIENGVENPFEKNSDNILKASVVTISSLTFDNTVNKYYTEKLKPIIVKNFQKV